MQILQLDSRCQQIHPLYLRNNTQHFKCNNSGSFTWQPISPCNG